MKLSMLHVGVLYPSCVTRLLRMVHFDTAAVFILQAPLPQSYLDDLPELLTDYKPLPKINQGFETRHSKAGKPY